MSRNFIHLKIFGPMVLKIVKVKTCKYGFPDCGPILMLRAMTVTNLILDYVRNLPLKLKFYWPSDYRKIFNNFSKIKHVKMVSSIVAPPHSQEP
jgi:hypothetical protein